MHLQKFYIPVQLLGCTSVFFLPSKSTFIPKYSLEKNNPKDNGIGKFEWRLSGVANKTRSISVNEKTF